MFQFINISICHSVNDSVSVFTFPNSWVNPVSLDSCQQWGGQKFGLGFAVGYFLRKSRINNKTLLKMC